jgi:sulfur-carrier protein
MLSREGLLFTAFPSSRLKQFCSIYSMKINILLFGQLAEITGSNTMELQDIKDTKTLIVEMNKKFPGLVDVKYVVSVDRQVITENTSLTDNNTIALLPPFSGG